MFGVLLGWGMEAGTGREAARIEMLTNMQAPSPLVLCIGCPHGNRANGSIPYR
jgi:hypothetical protein